MDENMESTPFRTLSNRKVASAACLSLVALALLLGPISLVRGASSDFSVADTTGGLCVNPGIDAQTPISISSQGGFAGTVNLATSVSPSYPAGLTVRHIPSSVTLTSGQTVSFELTIRSTPVTPLFNYFVTVYAYSGGTVHQAGIQVTVSSSCAVGGNVLPVNRLAILSPYLAIGALTLAAAGLAVTGIVYSARRKS